METLILIAGGDVGPIMDPVERIAELVVPTLRQADFRLAQCERTYSERGGWEGWKMTMPSGKHSRLPPHMAKVFEAANVNVVSLASNHAGDYGPDALLDTIDLFHSKGVQTIGAGRNAEEARRPAIIEKNSVRVAILGYCSVLREGQAAIDNKPGLAPLRAHTYYHPVEFQPGSPPNVISQPLAEDVEAMQRDIEKARKQADAVVLFIHWGLVFIPKAIASYQPIVAHAAIDTGADLILGHHSHCPKAIEVYKGKVCFYSIGNFMTTGSHEKIDPVRWSIYWFQRDPDSLYHFPIHCKQTILPKITFSKKGVDRVAFLPAYINKLAQPEVLKGTDPRFGEIVQTMEWVSDIVPHKAFRVEGDEVVVER